VKEVSYAYVDDIDGKPHYEITIKLLGTNSSAVGTSVTDQAMRSMYYAFTGEWQSASSITTSYYVFTVGYQFV
jgi:hypothetical protein